MGDPSSLVPPTGTTSPARRNKKYHSTVSPRRKPLLTWTDFPLTGSVTVSPGIMGVPSSLVPPTGTTSPARRNKKYHSTVTPRRKPLLTWTDFPLTGSVTVSPGIIGVPSSLVPPTGTTSPARRKLSKYSFQN